MIQSNTLQVRNEAPLDQLPLSSRQLIQLDRLVQGYGLLVASHRESAEDRSYLVDHTSRTYVLDRQGRMVLTYGGDMTAADLARDLRALLRN